MKISQIKKLYKNFGVNIALPSVCASSFRAASDWKHKRILDYLKSKYKDLILKYQQENFCETENHQSDIIWSLWWQDNENNLPETVRLCFESVKKNCGTHPFKIITENNYQDYINLPEHIMQKFLSGAITITHLSDIIRVNLLSNYGGLWLDASIFVADKIPEEIFSMKYFTVRRPVNFRSRNVSKDRWTGFLQAAEKENIFCRFIYDFFVEYWKGHKILIDYFLIDYVIEIAVEELPECKKIFEDIPINNKNIQELHEIMSTEFNRNVYEKLKNETNFFKLAWRTDYKKNISGHETFYGHLLNENGGTLSP